MQHMKFLREQLCQILCYPIIIAKGKVQAQLAEANYISLKTDCWTCTTKLKLCSNKRSFHKKRHRATIICVGMLSVFQQTYGRKFKMRNKEMVQQLEDK